MMVSLKAGLSKVLQESLFRRLVTYFLTLSLPVICLLAAITYLQSQKTLTLSIFSRLDTLADVKESDLTGWVENRLRDLTLLAGLPEMNLFIRSLSAGDATPSETSEAKSHLSDLLQYIQKNRPDFDEIFVLSFIGGRVLESTIDEHEGQYRIYDVCFVKGKEGPFIQNIYPSPITLKPTITVSAPVRSGNRRPVAVLAAHLSLDHIDKEILKTTGLGESGSVSLVDKYKVMVSGKVYGASGNTRSLSSQAIEAVIRGQSGWDLYQNEIGIPVIGVYRWLPEMDVGLLIEMEQKEAFRPARRLSYIILSAGLLLTGVLCGGIWWIARRMVRPILAMNEAALKVSQGDLQARSPVLTRDEIGVLAATFNRMVAELKGLYERMSEKIEALEKAENALRTSEERRRHVIENSPVLLWAVDGEGVFTFWEGRGIPGIESRAEEVVGRSVFEVYEGFSDFLSDIRKVLSGESFSSILRWGESFFETQYSPLTNGGGVINGAVGVATDITKRVQAQEEQRRLHTAMECADEEVILTDKQGLVEYVNPAFERVTGFERREAIGKVLGILQSSEQDPDLYRELWDTLLAGKTWRGRIRDRKKEGIAYDSEATISPILDASGKPNGYVVVKRDVTEQVKLQRQLFHAQRMEAVGTLAGGIAHDLNNVLQGVSGYSELLRMDIPEDSPMCRSVSQIEKAVGRGSQLIRQLLAFSRKLESVLVPTNLHQEIQTITQLLRRTIPRMIEIELHLQEDLWNIRADCNQIEQVLMNLGINASHAMPDGGRLIIETQNIHLDEEYCRVHLGALAGDYVLVTVTDTGMGMDKATLDQIFQPFFTTKGPGKGSGLGLSMVYGIVKNHGGYIMCYSEPGEGTTFKIYFPAVSEKVVPRPLEEPQIPLSFHGMETVLLVDDDESILDVGKGFLNHFGYKVLTSLSGEEALECYTSRRHPIDLVILDLNMPGMGGSQCLEELRRLDPEVKVVIASGYSPNGSARKVLESGVVGFLDKPFQLHEMMRLVRQVLNESRGSRIPPGP